MALFKILRGSKDALKNVKVKDGYAYFTPEDGKFYIDYWQGVDGVDPQFGIAYSPSNGVNRICINQIDDLIFDCGTSIGGSGGGHVPIVPSVPTLKENTYVICGNASNELDEYTAYFCGGATTPITNVVYNCGNSFTITE